MRKRTVAHDFDDERPAGRTEMRHIGVRIAANCAWTPAVDAQLRELDNAKRTERRAGRRTAFDAVAITRIREVIFDGELNTGARALSFQDSLHGATAAGYPERRARNAARRSRLCCGQ
jgi:hypothetical protein